MTQPKHWELEKEASVFALLLLMPEKLLKEELRKHPIELGSGKISVRRLAEKFQVSEDAVIARITLMNKIQP